ncbi:MAG TPA: efflux RND transporter periplasmic adaptor subunit [Fontimonas sp.]
MKDTHTPTRAGVRRLSSFAALTVAAALLGGCSKSPATDAAPTPSARSVRVAAVTQGPALPPIVATGVVASRDEAKLSFMMAGMVRDIGVREGDTVRAGQRIATLETTAVDAGVTQARAAADKAQRDLDRGRQLFEQDVITQEQLDDLGTAAAVAKAALDSAQYSRRYAEITAPADGRVLRRLAEPRELVNGGQPIVLVSRGAEGHTLKLGLPDRDFVHVRIGDRAKVRFDAYPRREFSAQIIERSEAADPRTGTFAVELSIDAGDVELANGLIGRAEIAASGGSAGTLDYVPLIALVEGAAGATLLFLYDPQTQTVSGRRVAVAFITDSSAALRESLPPGSQVVTEGAPYLDEGASVRVVE